MTWEQFVCCLPNVTQEIITDIKRGEKEKETSHMSAVAQHFIDNNSDITWRGIIDALLDANEVTAAHYILDKHSSKEISNLKCYY